MAGTAFPPYPPAQAAAAAPPAAYAAADHHHYHHRQQQQQEQQYVYDHGGAPEYAVDPASYGYPADPAAAAGADSYAKPADAAAPIVINHTTVTTVSEPECGCGIGWILFAIGWFLYLTWVVGAILFCLPHKKIDRPGLLGCLIMTIIGGILIIIAIVRANSTA